MEHQTDTKLTENALRPEVDLHRRRRSVLRSVLLLALCTIVLFVFILVQHDVRRRQRNMDDAFRCAGVLTGRIGEAGILPLNLEVASGGAPPVSEFGYLLRRDAHILRASSRPIITAWTAPVSRVFAPDGRAVIFFTNGRFDVEWLTLAEFDRSYAAQQDEIQRLGTEANREVPSRP